jgi:GNAT superfamily N-acetyltransferase
VPPSPITYREMTEEDLDAVDALFSRVVGHSRTREYWRWMLIESPEAEGFGFVAVISPDDSPEVVGLAVSMTRAFLAGGRRTRCGQSVDAMTRPDWQRKGINRRLNEMLVERNVRESIPYLMGFSNENSTKTVLSYQGRKVVGKFPVLLRPLSIVRALGRWILGPPSPPGARAAEIPDDAGALWDARGERMRMGSVRDLEYLRWRYRRPGGCYVPVELREEGRLEGFGLLGLRVQARLLTAFVMEAFVRGDDLATWKRLVRAMIREARVLGCDAICALAFPGMPERGAYSRAGLLPIPDWLNPEQIVFSLRTTGSEPAAKEAWDPRVWRLSWGDTDLV